MKTKLLKLVRRESKYAIFDLDNGNVLYGVRLSSKFRIEVENESIEEAILDRRQLRREHCIRRIKTLRADRMFRVIWVLKNMWR